jgi:hypothetical protein
VVVKCSDAIMREVRLETATVPAATAPTGSMLCQSRALNASTTPAIRNGMRPSVKSSWSEARNVPTSALSASTASASGLTRCRPSRLPCNQARKAPSNAAPSSVALWAHGAVKFNNPVGLAATISANVSAPAVRVDRRATEPAMTPAVASESSAGEISQRTR